MPANNRDYSFFGAWPRNSQQSNLMEKSTKICLNNDQPSSPISTPYNSRNNSPLSYPSSPVSTSPISTSPPSPSSSSTSSSSSTMIPSQLRRTYSSTFTLIPEDREIHLTKQQQQINADDYKKFNYKKFNYENHKNENPIKFFIFRLIFWWPNLILNIFSWILIQILRFLFIPFSFAAPSFWLSALLWIFWKFLQFPISLFEWFIGFIIIIPTNKINNDNNNIINNNINNNNNKKRTILISCGSTIQTLHLARNFYSSGARVIVFEFDGLFALSRFSTAVSKFYIVPRPTPDNPQNYIDALCDIVEKEKPSYYVPVCATSPAYYDSMAKSHLELLGCASFIPGLQENCILDDTFEMIKKCNDNGISVPQNRLITSKDDLFTIYNCGWISGFQNTMIATGLQGLLDRQKFILPNNVRDLKLTHEISDENRWLIIRNVPGNHYITCTTVKESKVIANVTCFVDPDTKSLMPEKNEQIEKWLNNFFTKIHLQRKFNGHISFRFVKCETTNQLLPLSSRVGVSIPYICYTGVHSRVLWKPCPHFNRKNSGPLIEENGRYWISEAVLNTLKHPSVNGVGKLIGTVLDKREALFVYWDPLPYCAYYHFQLPLKSVKSFVQKRQAAKSRSMATMTAPVH